MVGVRAMIDKRSLRILIDFIYNSRLFLLFKQCCQIHLKECCKRDAICPGNKRAVRMVTAHKFRQTTIHSPSATFHFYRHHITLIFHNKIHLITAIPPVIHVCILFFRKI